MIQYLVCLALTIYFFILLARIIFSFIPQLPEPVLPLARGVRAVTDPLLNPLRNLIPPIRTGAMAFDLSPILLFVGIRILQGLLGCR
jgi:YggT family protein